MVYGFKTYTHPFDLTVSGRLLVAPTINRTTYTPTCHSERSEESKRHINEMGLNKPITPIYSLDPNGVAVCPSGFDYVRYAHSAQDDNQFFVLCTWYNGNNGRLIVAPTGLSYGK